jgi:hypothetical protein
MGSKAFNWCWQFKIFRDFFWFLSVDLGGFYSRQHKPPEGWDRDRNPYL